MFDNHTRVDVDNEERKRQINYPRAKDPWV